MVSNGKLGLLGTGLLFLIVGISVLTWVSNGLSRTFGAAFLLGGVLIILISLAGIGRKS